MKLIKPIEQDYFFTYYAKKALRHKKAITFKKASLLPQYQSQKDALDFIINSETNGNCFFYSLLLAKKLNDCTLSYSNLKNLTANINDCCYENFKHGFVVKNNLVYDTSSKLIFDKDYYFNCYDVELTKNIDSSILNGKILMQAIDYSLENRPLLKSKTNLFDEFIK